MKALGCSFVSPEPIGQNYNMLRGAAYEQGRIQQLEINSTDCALKITEIRQIENGRWKCSVTTKKDDDNPNYDIGEGFIDVTVAIPPVEVFLNYNGERITGDQLDINLDEEKNHNIDCVATGSRPIPEFRFVVCSDYSPKNRSAIPSKYNHS